MTMTAHQGLAVAFRRLIRLAAVVAALGGVAGVAATGTARFIIWVVSGVLAAWLALAGFVESRRYQRHAPPEEEAHE